jgi:hypothetical protein
MTIGMRRVFCNIIPGIGVSSMYSYIPVYRMFMNLNLWIVYIFKNSRFKMGTKLALPTTFDIIETGKRKGNEHGELLF